jgi:TPP-dependent pyruvate/acetoin dehydrogenase alpha subunit
MTATETRRAELVRLFAAMSRIRAIEEAVAAGHRDGQLPGLLHLSMAAPLQQ